MEECGLRTLLELLLLSLAEVLVLVGLLLLLPSLAAGGGAFGAARAVSVSTDRGEGSTLLAGSAGKDVG